MIADPLVTAAIGVGAGVVTTVLAFLVKQSFETQQKISQTMLGLCIDCAGTVRAFEHHTESLSSGLTLMREPSSLDGDFAILRSLPSGLIVSPPFGLPKELVNLLPAEHAREVFLYFDCWERFSELESRYRGLFQVVLEKLAKAKFDPSEKKQYEFLRDEWFDQLRALVKDLYQTINRLAAHCCSILTFSQDYLSTDAAKSVERLTDGRWKSWQGIRDSCAAFRKACDSDRICTVSDA